MFRRDPRSDFALCRRRRTEGRMRKRHVVVMLAAIVTAMSALPVRAQQPAPPVEVTVGFVGAIRPGLQLGAYLDQVRNRFHAADFDGDDVVSRADLERHKAIELSWG